jgi:GNAT superfamily N-acetyltransferase
LIDIVLHQPLQRDYFAFVDSGLRGFLILGPVPATMGTWHLYWIAVHPSQQGTGIGRELQSFAESFIRDHGGYWLLAETSSQPGYARARSFYLKHEYVELVRIADYYRLSDDMIIYGKRLPSG